MLINGDDDDCGGDNEEVRLGWRDISQSIGLVDCRRLDDKLL